MTTPSAVVTGGCGFLGSHLVETLLTRGFRVAAIDNLATASPSNPDYLRALPQARERLKIVEADVCKDWQTWLPRDFLGDTAPWVFHFASPASPPHYQRLGLETMWVNTLGLSQSLAAADALGGRVVFASTSEIYGDPEVTPQPESYRGCVNTWGPRACYDEAKRFGEALIYTHNLKHGTRHGAVRIFNTYGPRMNPADGRVVINFLVQALESAPLTIYGDGSQTRSFCYVEDLVEGILRFADSGHTGPMNIGNEREFTIRELAEKVRGLFPDRGLKIEHHEFPPDDPKRRRPNLTLARAELDWEPRIPLEDGLARMLDWLRTAPREA
jgi:nucleoside-diphosphate-sugar epimerase